MLGHPLLGTLVHLLGRSQLALAACSDAALAALAATPDSNLHHLGAAGVAKLRGLNVAFLDGLAPPADGALPSRSQHGCRYHSQVRKVLNNTLQPGSVCTAAGSEQGMSTLLCWYGSAPMFICIWRRAGLRLTQTHAWA